MGGPVPENTPGKLTPTQVMGMYLRSPERKQVLQAALMTNAKQDPERALVRYLDRSTKHRMPVDRMNLVTESLDYGNPRAIKYMDTPIVPVSDLGRRDLGNIAGYAMDTADDYTGEGGVTPTEYYEGLWGDSWGRTL